MKTPYWLFALISTLSLGINPADGANRQSARPEVLTASSENSINLARFHRHRNRRNQTNQNNQDSAVFWTRQITPSAIPVGYENNQTLYGCRVAYQGGLHPGKLINTDCHFGFGGRELRSSTYEVLSYQGNNNYQWMRPPINLSTAVVGGQEANGASLWICRANYQGGLHPGKLVGNRCNIGFGGDEIQTTDYEVLVSDRSQVSNIPPNIPHPNNYPGSSPHGTQFYWSSELVGNNTFPVGRENSQLLYACRTSYQGGIHPGKLINNHCNFGFGGEELQSLNYQVLTYQGNGNDYQWMRPPINLSTAVVGGQEANGDSLWICRANYQGGLHPGKLVGNRCNVGFGGDEIQATDYEILVNR